MLKVKLNKDGKQALTDYAEKIVKAHQMIGPEFNVLNAEYEKLSAWLKDKNNKSGYARFERIKAKERMAEIEKLIRAEVERTLYLVE